MESQENVIKSLMSIDLGDNDSYESVRGKVWCGSSNYAIESIEKQLSYFKHPTIYLEKAALPFFAGMTANNRNNPFAFDWESMTYRLYGISVPVVVIPNVREYNLLNNPTIHRFVVHEGNTEGQLISGEFMIIETFR